MTYGTKWFAQKKQQKQIFTKLKSRVYLTILKRGNYVQAKKITIFTIVFKVHLIIGIQKSI